jgi:hypothetical protein
MGPAVNLLPLVTRGVTYDITLWARLSDPTDAVVLTLKTLCREPTDTTTSSTYSGVAPHVPATNVWKRFSGTFTVPTCEAPKELQDLKLIVEGPAGGVDIYVDDVKLQPLAP